MRPWALPDPEYLGSEEIIGPGCLECIGLSGIKVLDLAQIAASLAPLCESPIEVQLGAWLVRLLADNPVVVIPQYRWVRYRIDFALVLRDQPLVFIECDGKEFHSTAEQIQRDRQKDAAARDADIPLLRFSGSDIYWNAEICAALAIRELP